MANKKISDLTAGTPPYLGTTLLELAVANGGGFDSRKGRLADLAATVKRSISSAELKALNTSPVLLLAAPGANKVHVITSTVYKYIFNTAAYVEGAASNIIYGTTAAGAASADQGDQLILENAADTVAYIGAGGYNNGNTAAIVNKALSLSNGAGNPTTGSGTLILSFTYITVDLS